MIDMLAQILPASQAALFGLWVVFLRIGAMVAVLPAFGEQMIPMRIRLGLAIAFTLVVAPAVSNQTAALNTDSFWTPALTGTEILAGLFFGLLLRLFVFALQIAGSIAAQSTSLSQIFGGSAGVDPQPAMGHVLVMAGVALAAMMGLHVQFASYMIYTYQMAPAGIIVAAEPVMQLGLPVVGRVFALGFTLAAPFVIASLMYNVTLGVINRAMPQLMVSFVGAPAITAGGLILLALSAPMMLSVWLGNFTDFVFSPLGN